MLKIEEIFAFVAEDEEDQVEGVCGYKTRNGWLPMVGADQTRVASLRPFAQIVANATGKEITLAKFTVRTDVETIVPNNQAQNPTGEA